MTASDLHLSGVCAMFIASKYEDIVPLMMRTVLKKIGHGKFTLEQTQVRELEILQALSYRVGIPTV